MAAGKVYSFYKDLPSWAKGVVIIGGLGVTYIFASQIIKIIRTDADKRKSEEGLKDTRDEQTKLEEEGVSRSFPKSTYKGWADNIEEQFTGCDSSSPLIPSNTVGIPYISGWSASAVTLFNILNELKTDLDFVDLIDAFAFREYDDCIFGTVKGNLYKAVSNELNTTEVKGMNDLLKTKGIKYKF
jgi:hypothetical protein